MFLERSEAALDHVSHKLQEEFDSRFAGSVNPMQLTARIKGLERELPELKQQCQDLIRSKQELIDSSKKHLSGNRDLLQQLCTKSGLVRRQQDDSFKEFSTAISEWDRQIYAANSQAPDPGNLLSRYDLNAALAGTVLNR